MSSRLKVKEGYPLRVPDLILAAGRIVITSDSISFSEEFDYGPNIPFLKGFVLAYVKFLSDSPLVTTTGDKPVKVYTRFLRTLVSNDLRLTIKLYSGYADDILSSQYVTGGVESTFHFLDAMKDTPIFKEYLTWYRTRDPELLRYVLSFLRFGKKLAYVDSKLDATAFRGWLEVEEKLRTLKFDPHELATLAKIVRVLLKPITVDTILPHFGGGKVSERHIRTVWDKLHGLALTRRLAYVFRNDSLFAPGATAGMPLTTEWNSYDVARLHFVPKDISKSRSICMEPNSHMLFQQEVLRWMVSSISSSPAGRFIHLDDQTVNQKGAIRGSKYLDSDTLDLSSASDSVHVDLVRAVFPRDWLYYMLGTRTSKVLLPSGEIVRVNKFAPMGSAVCFPTQSILFTAICIYGYLMHHLRRDYGPVTITEALVRGFLAHGFESWVGDGRYVAPVVYGDDIIVDHTVSDIVITLLERFGFSVNVSKSFTGSQSIRESCGVYVYEGSDVTPVIYRVKFFQNMITPDVYAGLIDQINNLNSHGYHSCASYLLAYLRGCGFRSHIPFKTSEEGFGIFTKNKHVPSETALRENADWQILEELVLGIGTKGMKGTRPDNLELYSYYQWQRSRVDDNVAPSFGRRSSIRPWETRFVPRWVRYE
jgi:hypothetical protein